MFIPLPHEREEVIVRSDFVEDLFSAFDAGMFDHIALVFTVVDVGRFHFRMAIARTVSGKNLVHMFGREADRAVVSGGPFGVKRDDCAAELAGELFVSHDKSHTDGVDYT